MRMWVFSTVVSMLLVVLAKAVLECLHTELHTETDLLIQTIMVLSHSYPKCSSLVLMVLILAFGRINVKIIS